MLDWNLFPPFLALENDTRWTGDYLRLSCSGRGDCGGKKDKGLGNLVKLIVATSVAGMSAARICVCSQLSLRVSVWPAAFYHDAFFFHI
jgi:hypothetical protein